MTARDDSYEMIWAPPKSLEAVTAEWDAAALPRQRQLMTGVDASFQYVLQPTVLTLLRQFGAVGPILDVGSGVGTLSYKLAERFERVTALDPSSESTRLADVWAPPHLRSRIEFVTDSAEGLAPSVPSLFGCAVANMVLMDAPDLEALMDSVADMTITGGIFVATITHPYFWPLYWGYSDAEWFCYDKETFIQGEFHITNGGIGAFTTHVHRPLEMYVNAIRRSGFEILKLVEPGPVHGAPRAYLDKWKFPRFLGFACQRSNRRSVERLSFQR